MPDLPGINVDEGLARVRHKVDFYRRMLLKFRDTHAAELAHDVTLGTRPHDLAYCAALAGDYLFVGYVQHMTVLVYRRADLALVGRLDAGPQSQCPIFDGQPELIARRLSDGGYALFLPQYQGNAVTVLRWDGTTAPRPAAPVARAARGGGGAELTWEAVPGASGWTVERRTCTAAGWGRWEPAATLSAGERGWRDPAASAAALAYRVCATAAGGRRSDWSATAYLR